MYPTSLQSRPASRPFSAFGRYRMEGLARTQPTAFQGTGPDLTVRDTFLAEGDSLAPKRVISLFLFGLGLGLAGKGLAQSAMERWRLAPKKGDAPFTPDTFHALKAQDPKTKPTGPNAPKTQELKANPTEPKDGSFYHELTILEQYEKLATLYLMGQYAPHLRKPILGYAGTAIMGYSAASFAQGTQEAWVRKEETKIRARLINEMTRAFRQSIRVKQDFDNQLREEARARILDLLQRHQVPDAAKYVWGGQGLETAASHQRALGEPIVRTAQPIAGATPLKFGQDPLESLPGLKSFWPDASEKGWPSRLIQGGIVGAGVITGLAVGAFQRLFTGGEQERAFPGEIKNFKNLTINSPEAIALHGFANRQKNFFIMVGFFALAGALKLGKLVLDGLREIEVTRVNARTELAYQTHNWLSQDPAFHRIAVTEALENGLRQLEQDLSALKLNPAALKQRIDSILAVELKAAPAYWPMTPPVQLSVARG
jgi:hypothetical protein